MLRLMDNRDDEDHGLFSSGNLMPITSPELIDKGASYDRISVLPDDILIAIVSLLTLREAAQTSILSKPWRFLWMKRVNLEFDTKNMTGKDETEHYLDSSITLKNKRLNFAVWVRRILNIHDGPKINQCRLIFYLGTDFGKEMKQWIQVLADKQVENLYIDFSDTRIPHNLTSRPDFPHWSLVLPHLKHLTLRTCALKAETVCFGLRNLLSLSLYQTVMSQEIMDNIVCSCLFLQSLSISHCSASQILIIGSDDCSLMNLTHLNISFCPYLEFVIVSGATRLLSLEQRGDRLLPIRLMKSAIPVRLCLHPHEEKARLDQIFDDLSVGYSQLEVLLLNVNMYRGYRKLKQLHELTKLREIVVMIQGSDDADLIEIIAFVIRKSPFLQKLELHLPESDKYGDNTRKYIFVHDLCQLKKKSNSRYGVPRGGNLKEVKLFNFNGKTNQMELALFLLKNVDALERLIIDRHGKIYEGDERWRQSSIIPRLSKHKVQEMMVEEVPSSVMLDVL